MAHTKWTPVQLPFLIPPHQLPAPLPSEGEILGGTIIHGDPSHHCIVAVGSHFVAKYGRHVSDGEGQNLLFLERYTDESLTAPKLFAMWQMQVTGYICLVMQRLPGESLEELWPQLIEEQKETVCSMLKNNFNSIRSISSSGFYGSISRLPLSHHFFWDQSSNPAICGPFNSEAELNAAIVQKLKLQSKENGGYNDRKVEFYEKHMDTILSRHDPIFSHSDLQRKNILVHQQAGKIVGVAIVDWEDAGWYPSYWEYCLQFATMGWVDDWPRRLEDIIAPWPNEAVAFNILYREMYF